MKKNCKVSLAGNIGFTLVDGGPTLLVAVPAPAGTRLTVDTALVTVTGEPFSKTFTKDGVTRTTVYVEAEAKDGAVSYRKLATIVGTPPASLKSSADEEV